MASSGFDHIDLSVGAERFFDAAFADQVALAGAEEVAREAMGPDGILMRHWLEGQGEWPANSVETTKRKGGDGRRFVETGRVLAAIGQKLGGLLAAKFGSSADVYSGQKSAVQVVSRGVYVRVTPGRTTRLRIGFVGAFRKSAGWKRFERKVRDREGWSEAKTRRYQRMFGVRKHGAFGSAGFRLEWSEKKQRHVGKMLGVGDENNLAYANVLQAGSFKGVRSAATGKVVSARALAYGKRALRSSDAGARAVGAKLLAGTGKGEGGEVARGKRLPLLPVKQRDMARIAAAYERGALAYMAKLGLVAE